MIVLINSLNVLPRARFSPSPGELQQVTLPTDHRGPQAPSGGLNHTREEIALPGDDLRPFVTYGEGMATTHLSPATPDAEHNEPGRRSTARSMVRGAGAFLDAVFRVVLFGGQVKH